MHDFGRSIERLIDRCRLSPPGSSGRRGIQTYTANTTHAHTPQKGRDEATGLTLHGLRLDAAAPAGGSSGGGGSGLLLSRLAGPKLAIHTFKLSEDHAPGLHWYRVGSEQEGGPGFRGAFHVLPRVSSQGEVGSGKREDGSDGGGGGGGGGNGARLLLLQYEPEAGAYLVNGQQVEQEEAPLGVRAGEEQVLDLAHAGGPHLLEVEVEGEGDCSLRLLALDGVALPDGPRHVTHVGLAALQRARVLLSCQSVGEVTLVSRPAAARDDAGLPDGARWGPQRLLGVSVGKPNGLGQLLPFNRRLPLLPVRPRVAVTHDANQQQQQQQYQQASSASRPWYLRDLSHALTPPTIATCEPLALTCPPSASCPAGRHPCQLLDAQEQQQRSSLRELTVTLTHPVPPAAAVRLAPALPFQILDFTPAAGNTDTNAYVEHGGQLGGACGCLLWSRLLHRHRIPYHP
jgi:hypothetical protein